MDIARSTRTTPQATRPMLRNISTNETPMSFFLLNAFRPWLRGLLELEVDSNRHDYGDGDPVQKCRAVDPLLHGIDRGLIKQRDTPERTHVTDSPLRVDGALQNDDSLNPGLLGDRRIGGIDVL